MKSRLCCVFLATLVMWLKASNTLIKSEKNKQTRSPVITRKQALLSQDSSMAALGFRSFVYLVLTSIS